jgi:ABC-type transporter Mla subunit MlaD
LYESAPFLKQAQSLSLEEQLELIRQLTAQASTQFSVGAKTKRKVTDFYSVAPNLLSGIDAQVWVSQLRDVISNS